MQEKRKELIIISGASSGIGFAAAELLTERGYEVYGGYRKLPEKKPKFHPILLDVTDPQSVTAAVEKLPLDKASKVHLINNAGIAVAGPMEAVPLQKWREQIDVNFLFLL